MNGKKSNAAHEPSSRWLIQFLGLSFNHKQRAVHGKRFRVHVCEEACGTAIFQAMHAADRICKFFEPRMEIAVLISTRQIAPVIGLEDGIAVPAEWMDAYERSDLSEYVFNQKGEVITDEKPENLIADDKRNRKNATDKEPAATKRSNSVGRTKGASTLSGKRQNRSARRKSGASDMGRAIPSRKAKKSK